MKIKYMLYIDRALNSWGERCWEFAIGLYLIKLNPDSLLLTALQGILASSLTIVISPLLGRWISRAPRLKEIGVFIGTQATCVVISAASVALFFSRDYFENERFKQIIENVSPTFLAVFSSIAQVASCGYTISLEKDWILTIAENEKELSELNAVLRRLDLLIKTIAPLLVGLVMQYSDLFSALFLMSFNSLAAIAEYFIMAYVYRKIPALKKPKFYALPSTDHAIAPLESIRVYSKYFLLPGISFGLLFLSIFGFDSVTVGYVESEGISEGFIGLVSVVAALFGILGTLFFQFLVKHLSLEKITLIGYVFDLAPLSLCLLVAVAPGHNLGVKVFGKDLAIILFLTGITISRIGLWTIDLSTNQWIQTKTPNPPLIGGIQSSVNTFAELAKFIIVAVLPALSQFWILIIVSYTSITLSGFLYIIFDLRQSKQQLDRKELMYEIKTNGHEKKDYGSLKFHESC